MPQRKQDPLVVPDISKLDDEQRLQLAVKAIDDSDLLPDGTRKLSFRQAAKAFQVPCTSLAARYRGALPKKKAHESQQKLTRAQEDVLVEWVKVQGRRGVPISPSALADHAAAIAGTSIGHSWPNRFLGQHPDLKMRWSRSLEKCRANNANPATIRHFYDMYEEVVKEFNIPKENVYNMDEKGIQLGVGKRVTSIIDRDQKEVYNIEDGNRELVTMIETVCADGSTLPPSAIFKGARINPEWGRTNPANARCVIFCSPQWIIIHSNLI